MKCIQKNVEMCFFLNICKLPINSDWCIKYNFIKLSKFAHQRCYYWYDFVCFKMLVFFFFFGGWPQYYCCKKKNSAEVSQTLLCRIKSGFQEAEAKPGQPGHNAAGWQHTGIWSEQNSLQVLTRGQNTTRATIHIYTHWCFIFFRPPPRVPSPLTYWSVSFLKILKFLEGYVNHGFGQAICFSMLLVVFHFLWENTLLLACV